MHDRGMIKWAPFNSVVNSKYLIKEIENDKAKIYKPSLSDEQMEYLESKIFESYFNVIPIEITIYQKGYLKMIKGTVTKILKAQQKIFLDNEKDIHFCEIVKIKYADLL